MLVHINQPDVAELVHNAWLKTIEDGIHTYDIYKEGVSTEKVGTKEFAQAVIKRIGQKPQKLTPATYNAADESSAQIKSSASASKAAAKKTLVGVDVFLDWNQGTANQLGDAITQLNGDGLKLSHIDNRGVKVYPDGFPETFCSNSWRCRFKAEKETITQDQIIALLQRLRQANFDFVKFESLFTLDGELAYTLGQGE